MRTRKPANFDENFTRYAVVEKTLSQVDWRRHGLVSAVKNQGACGSCWAFAAVGVVEAIHAKLAGQMIDLSEQQLVDCADGTWLSKGCQGGSVYMALLYVKKEGGLVREEAYPYAAADGRCEAGREQRVATISNITVVTSGSESGLADALSSIGPVAVGIDASHRSFMSYSEGIYDESSCSSSQLNHGVLAVGFTEDAWIVKNSWGSDWGENGYARMSRNKENQCGIATAAIYAR